MPRAARGSKNATTNKVIVIGLDGATFDLIKPWMEEGKLPHLRDIMGRGVHRCLMSTIHPSSEQAWPSFMTGKNNGKHGIFGFQMRVDGTYNTHITNASHVRGPTLWRILSDWGKRVAVINVPMTYPPEPVNGVLISGLGTPSVDSTFTYPADLYQELKGAVGEYVIEPTKDQNGFLSEDEALSRFAESVLHTIEMRLNATKYIAQTRDWDFLMVVFGASDRVCHSFWKYIDPAHPQYREEEAKLHGQVIADTYAKLDEAVGELLNSIADDNMTVFVISDHGFGPIYKVVYLNRWLELEGFLVRDVDGGAGQQIALQTSLQRAFSNLLRWCIGHLDGFAPFEWLKAKAIYQWLPQRFRDKVYATMAFSDINWLCTRAYALGPWGSIYLNVAGREPQGVVEPGESYHRIREEIIERLKEFRDPDTGELVFTKVYRREEVYTGPCLELAPDIVPLIREDMYQVATIDWRADKSAVIASLDSGLQFAEGRSGNHNRRGIFMAFGQHIGRGQVLDKAQIIDLTPTILYLLGLPVPSDMDGQVLTDIFANEYVEEHPVVYGEKEVDDTQWGSLYTAEEAELVEEHLRQLGYLD